MENKLGKYCRKSYQDTPVVFKLVSIRQKKPIWVSNNDSNNNKLIWLIDVVEHAFVGQTE